MSWHTTSFFISFLITMPAFADDNTKTKTSIADRLAAIQKEHKAAEAAFYKAVTALTDTPEDRKKGEALWRAYDKSQAERFLAAVELAKAAPHSDSGFAALEWVLTIPRSYYQPAGKLALELATEHHAANPKVGKIVAWVGYYRPQQGESQAAAAALIETVATKNPDRTARGQAVMAKARQAIRMFQFAEYKKAPDVEKLAAKAEKVLEAILNEYADCPQLIREGSPPLGVAAKKELFELRHLRVGKVAPDIEGEDLDGVKFKLSDYRGKVVVLNFWGDW